MKKSLQKVRAVAPQTVMVTGIYSNYVWGGVLGEDEVSSLTYFSCKLLAYYHSDKMMPISPIAK